jgi:hypothetical protein
VWKLWISGQGEQGEKRQGKKEGEVKILYLLATPNNVFDQKQLCN